MSNVTQNGLDVLTRDARTCKVCVGADALVRPASEVSVSDARVIAALF